MKREKNQMHTERGGQRPSQQRAHARCDSGHRGRAHSPIPPFRWNARNGLNRFDGLSGAFHDSILGARCAQSGIHRLIGGVGFVMRGMRHGFNEARVQRWLKQVNFSHC